MTALQVSALLIFVAVGFIAFVAGRLTAATPKPESSKPKRFGLMEVEVLYEDIRTPESARLVMDTIEILGYENKVAEDLTAISSSTNDLNDGSRGQIAFYEEEIRKFESMIFSLKTTINIREAELAEKKRAAALFTAAA